LGYVRDQRLTFLLGTTAGADSFIIAYRIPNLLRRLVGEGAMTASFIPVFTSYMAEKSREELWRFANRVFWTLALVLAILTVLGMVSSRIRTTTSAALSPAPISGSLCEAQKAMTPWSLSLGNQSCTRAAASASSSKLWS